MKRVLLLLAGLAAAFLAGRDIVSQLHTPLAMSEPRTIEVPYGATMNGLLRELERDGVLASARQRLYLSWYARLTGQADALKAGEYAVGTGLRATDLTALLASGQVILHELRLIEGWTFEQALAAVRAHPALKATLPQAGASAALMAGLGKPDLHPEGRFYPDTYRFARGTTDVEFLRRAHKALEAVLAQEWEGRAPDLPYASADEALIMASIVERETGQVDERAEIAGVFVRRLQKRMRLQTDPSVIYGLGAKFDGNLRKRDLLADGPYNTYTRYGLPPTPIALPGRAALHAALHPAAGKTLYFVARGDGSHVFTETFAEHDAAVREYQLKRRRR
ncbi:MAG: endolytic transglycosylase MltG [Gammaproteobacteria bacterium]